MQGESLGSVEFGQVFYFSISNRDSSGGTLAFVPAFFDVYDLETGDLVLMNQTFFQNTGLSDHLWFGSINTSSQATDQDLAWEAGKTYGLLVKETSVADPGTFIHFHFTVTGAYSARLKRILGLSGEHMVLDKLVYNTGNSATSFRIRLFDTLANAQAATIDASAMEIGELYRYDVTQTYQVGVQLRKSQRTAITVDPGDE